MMYVHVRMPMTIIIHYSLSHANFAIVIDRGIKDKLFHELISAL